MVNRPGRRGRQALLVLHYVTSVGWLGGGLGQLTVNVVALGTGDPALRHAAHEIAHAFDISILTVLSLGSAVTGILLGLRGRWGLLRYRWVAVKLVVTVALILLVPVVVGGWNRAAVRETAYGPGSPEVRAELLGSSVVIVAVLVTLTVISVVKPWGRLRAAAPKARSRMTLPYRRRMVE